MINDHFYKIYWVLLVLALGISITSCTGSTSNGLPSSQTGFLSLSLNETQEFNPNVSHGDIDRYKVTITGSTLIAPIVKYYEAGTTSASFDDFADGTTLTVLIEYINVNGLTVRRGQSQTLTITAGQTTAASLDVNNVPVFANVRDGATVYNNRFVPEVFAPGAIEFQVSDFFNASESILSDVDSGLASFSINEDDATSTVSINVPELSAGDHELTVTDTDTGESSTITVTVLQGSTQNGVVTTAGAYLGSPMSEAYVETPSNLFYFFGEVMP